MIVLYNVRIADDSMSVQKCLECFGRKENNAAIARLICLIFKSFADQLRVFSHRSLRSTKIPKAPGR